MSPISAGDGLSPSASRRGIARPGKQKCVVLKQSRCSIRSDELSEVQQEYESPQQRDEGDARQPARLPARSLLFVATANGRTTRRPLEIVLLPKLAGKPAEEAETKKAGAVGNVQKLR